MSEDPNTYDPLSLFDGLQPLMETLRGMVAVLVNEGFTEREARALVVKVITMPSPGNE